MVGGGHVLVSTQRRATAMGRIRIGGRPATGRWLAAAIPRGPGRLDRRRRRGSDRSGSDRSGSDRIGTRESRAPPANATNRWIGADQGRLGGTAYRWPWDAARVDGVAAASRPLASRGPVDPRGPATRRCQPSRTGAAGCTSGRSTAARRWRLAVGRPTRAAGGPGRRPRTSAAGHRADRYRADRYRADRYRADRYRADRYRRRCRRADEVAYRLGPASHRR